MKDRYRVITWQRGYHSIVDNGVPIGHPNRYGSGFKRLREAQVAARRMNRQAKEN